MSNFLCAVLKKANNERKEFDFGGSHIFDGKTIGEIQGGSSKWLKRWEEVYPCDVDSMVINMSNICPPEIQV